MDAVLLVVRLALGVVFVTSGVAKLLDRPGTRRAVGEFGVPARYVPAVGALLAPLEIILGVLLVPVSSARFAAAGLVALTIAFAAGVVANLRRGNAPDCHCFGALHSERASWRVVVRDLLLAGLAAVVVFGNNDRAGASLSRWLSDGWSRALAVSTVGLVVACAYLLRERQRLLAIVANGSPASGGVADDASGLPIGSPSPRFEATTIDGATVSLDALSSGGLPVMLIFSDPSCEVCHQMLGYVGQWQRDAAGRLSIAVISAGPRGANRMNGFDLGAVPFLVQHAQEIADDFQVSAIPSAVIVSVDGLIASDTVAGGQAIRDLMQRSIDQARPAEDALVDRAKQLLPPLVERVPPIQLRGLDGAVVELRGLLRQRTLMLFWDPESSHCRRILEALRAAGNRPLSDGVKLLVVSSGTASATSAAGFDAQALVDESALIGRAIGAPGAPAAVVVESGGTIHSPISVGTAAVLALLQTGGASRASPEQPDQSDERKRTQTP